MELLILDNQFISSRIIDRFESVLWTERYNGYGNFELYTPISDMIIDFVKELNKTMEEGKDTYVWLKDSDDIMIIETTEFYMDTETGGQSVISGRSLESLLERRIVWEQTILNGNLQNGIEKLLNENVINPKISDRKIPNFIFERSTDPEITKLTIQAQFTGDILYDVISNLCNSNHLGFEIILDASNRFVFRLYRGIDHSYEQEANPYVIFSPKYDNLINSRSLSSKNSLKNVALVAGEDEAQNRKTRIVGTGKGLSRRELYVDARDVRTETESGKLTEAEYNAQLDQRGTEKLDENKYTKIFEGQIESKQTFVYPRDFKKGDIVQIQTEYGQESKVRVIEVVRSEDTSGYNIYPTFSIIDK